VTSWRVGLALGSGSARGWAHIGVIRALEAEGIVPDVVAGTSIGALVGAAYVGNELDTLENWLRGLTRRDVMRYLDFTLAGGGFIEGERLMNFFRGHIDPGRIENLQRPFACVATELETGREVWLQRGDVLDAVRASYALPGLFTPVHDGKTWLVDGGLVNPVPVSVCRALGADVVIAVNLNGDILGKRNRPRSKQKLKRTAPKAPEEIAADNAWVNALNGLKERAGALLSQLWEEEEPRAAGAPGLFDVVAGAINIMQVRITRSRMAGDPPDVVLTPHLAHIELLEFHRAGEAIDEGREVVERMLPAIRDALS